MLSRKDLCDKQGLLWDIVVCSPKICCCSHKLHRKVVLLVKHSLAYLCGPALQVLPYALNQYLCKLIFGGKKHRGFCKREERHSLRAETLSRCKES